MVMPFSRSRSPESMARSSTCWCSPNAPDCQSILSTRVVLPWSTWATMATLRMSARVFMGMRNSLSGFRGCFGPRRRGVVHGWLRVVKGGSGVVEEWFRGRSGAGRAREHGFEPLDDGQVGRQPADGAQVAQVQPPQFVVVLDGRRDALDH